MLQCFQTWSSWYPGTTKRVIDIFCRLATMKITPSILSFFPNLHRTSTYAQLKFQTSYIGDRAPQLGITSAITGIANKIGLPCRQHLLSIYLTQVDHRNHIPPRAVEILTSYLHQQPDLTRGHSIRFHIQSPDVYSGLTDIDEDIITMMSRVAG